MEWNTWRDSTRAPTQERNRPTINLLLEQSICEVSRKYGLTARIQSINISGICFNELLISRDESIWASRSEPCLKRRNT